MELTRKYVEDLEQSKILTATTDNLKLLQEYIEEQVSKFPKHNDIHPDISEE